MQVSGKQYIPGPITTRSKGLEVLRFVFECIDPCARQFWYHVSVRPYSLCKQPQNQHMSH
jgi:hypothetical protein